MAPQVLHRVIYGLPTSTISKHHSSDPPRTIPALLPSHRRHRVLQADYPAITPHPSSSVRGTYVTGLSAADIWRLDIFEGEEYARQPVSIRLLDTDGNDGENGKEGVEGTEVQTQTYVWIGGAHRLEDKEWDFGAFQREKMWRWTGRAADAEGEFDGESNPDPDPAASAIEGENEDCDGDCDSSAEVDEAVKKQDDGTGGRGANGAIGKALQEVQQQKTKMVVDKEVVESAV